MDKKFRIPGGGGGGGGDGSAGPGISRPPLRRRLLGLSSALFYGGVSFLIMIANKSVLTSYRFPSFQVLCLGQMAVTVLLLLAADFLGVIAPLPPVFSVKTFRKIWPLPLFFIGNMVTGLSSTRSLSLPMLTVLRRGTILMAMVGEYIVLGQRPRAAVQASVYLMILGALIAAANDLAFNLQGYTSVLLNDLCSAAQMIYFKKKLDSKDISKNGIMFLNSLLMFPPTLAVALSTGELDAAADFEDWADPGFAAQLFLALILGLLLNYTMMLCTQHNSPLATTVVGAIKNVAVTYVGTVVGGDYVFSWANFAGINVSVVGSLVYTYVAVVDPVKAAAAATTEDKSRTRNPA